MHIYVHRWTYLCLCVYIKIQGVSVCSCFFLLLALKVTDQSPQALNPSTPKSIN